MCLDGEEIFFLKRVRGQYEYGNVSDTTFLAHPKSSTVRNFQLKRGEID